MNVGLPAKSGVAGLVYIVVPNVMGIAVFSPRLDHHGNSVRAVEFARRLLSLVRAWALPPDRHNICRCNYHPHHHSHA